MHAAIIGSGPAGLMAAEVIASAGHPVTVFERMPSPGRKFLMAGRGGLNLTHSEPFERFLARYGRASPFLAPFLEAFPPSALRAWADALGAETFTGSSGRVFPRAWKASPLLRAWLRRLDGLGVTIRTHHRFTFWDGPALIFETPTGPARIEAPATILALGGATWPRLGTDGAWADTLGLPVIPLRPANMGVHCPWSPVFRARAEGQPLKRIALTFGTQTIRGETVVTATGLEGGAIYALSGAIRDALDRGEPATLTLDLRPDLDLPTLTARLGGPGVSTANALRRAGLDPVAASLAREFPDSRPLGVRIKSLAIPVTGTSGLARAISTAGGVPFTALDGLMLRTRPGVFVAGEMLDWDAPTGGYLLQACFATGYAAGQAAVGRLGQADHYPR